MRDQIFTVLVIMVTFYTSSSQKTIEDSLLSVIETTTGKEKVNTIYQLGKHYVRNNKAAEAIDILQEGINLGTSINDFILTGGQYEFLGIAYDLQGKLDSALWAYDNSMELYRQVEGSEYEQNQVIMNRGIAHFYAGNSSKALQNYLQAYEMAEEFGFKDILGKLVNNIAIIYRRETKFEDALEYYKKSLAIKLENGERQGAANTYQNMGLCFSYLDQIDSALFYLQKSKEIFTDIDAPSQEMRHVDLNLAVAHFQNDNFEVAFDLLESAKSANWEGLPTSLQIQGRLYLAKLYEEKKDARSALDLYEEVELLLDGTDFDSEKLDLHSSRAAVYASIGNFRNATNEYEKAIAILQDQSEEEAQRLEAEMMTKFNTLQKEAEIEKLALEDKLQRTQLQQQRIALFLLLGLLSLLSFLLYRLREQKKLIDEKNKVNETLLKEIHHRVKNNLQVISSLLKLQSRRVDDKGTQNVLKEGQSRVRSMALIHQYLYEDEKLSTIDMKGYLTQLTEEILENYKIDKEVALDLKIEELQLDVDSVISLGLIINELITNSLKYAFDETDHPSISISFMRSDIGIKMLYKDNGSGFDFSEVSTRSLGMRLIKSFSNRLRASQAWETDGKTELGLVIPFSK